MAIAHEYVPVPPKFGGGRLQTAKSVTADCGPISANMDQTCLVTVVCVRISVYNKSVTYNRRREVMHMGVSSIHNGISKRNRIQVVMWPQPKCCHIGLCIRNNDITYSKAVLIRAAKFFSQHRIFFHKIWFCLQLIIGVFSVRDFVHSEYQDP